MWKRDMRHENLKSQVSSLESIPDVFKITEEAEESLDPDMLLRSDTGDLTSRASFLKKSLQAFSKGLDYGASEAIRDGNHDDMVEKIESLRAEILKLGKAQIQTRMFAESEYRALHEAFQKFFVDNDHVAEMVIEDLFSIADGLEAGIRAGGVISSPEMVSWLDGMKIVYQRVMELLEKFDVYPLYSVGKPFDPSLHVAVAVEHLQEVDDNIILEEQRRGYTRGDKMIRYAEVVVNKHPLESAVQEEENDE